MTPSSRTSKSSSNTSKVIASSDVTRDARAYYLSEWSTVNCAADQAWHVDLRSEYERQTLTDVLNALIIPGTDYWCQWNCAAKHLVLSRTSWLQEWWWPGDCKAAAAANTRRTAPRRLLASLSPAVYRKTASIEFVLRPKIATIITRWRPFVARSTLTNHTGLQPTNSFKK